ncbi:WD repeat-containing protein 97 [Eublepharis macularius]|uniref:WD repeat-containing protein 97 n=1 Tax=Eublepharis macularius TaxID=481883 RepID=A0AA97JK62_EUBMA|nr:WD repeat-containing protein 97 [Eublepharis macularius]
MQARGQQRWQRLQRGFRRAVEKIKSEEVKVSYLSHGLQHLCHITLLSPVRHVTHNCLKKVFVVLDAADSLHFYREDGSYLSSRGAPLAMRGLLYASQADRFVAWDKDGLQVLDSSCKVLSEVQSALPIRCSIYSELLNRIVTAGDGNLTIWAFRYGCRSLQCRFTISEGLGPSNLFSHLALDASGAEPQRCFASCDTGAAAVDISSGALIAFETKLHSRIITDIAYCEVVGSPVTASRDTTIKVWDQSWHIRTVFVGHTGPVIALAIYPQRPLIFSASQDGTIRTWNLDTVDQVDQVHVLEPVEALETQTTSRVISISGTSLTLWKINQLYSFYTPLGSPAKHLSYINLKAVANFPVRILCVCQDSSVRVLDALTGTVLAILSLDPSFQVLDVAYCLPRETLFVLMESGTLLRVNAATDPMVVKKSTARPSGVSQPCCLLLYSHIVDPKKAYSTWVEVVENQSDKKSWQKPPLKMQDKNRYVLIMGQEDGLLSVVEWFSGRIQCQVEAHCPQRVTTLAEYPSQTCIISAGTDLTVKMWRVFPYAEESLVPLLCFSCAVPAWHMCCLGETLAVAFQDPETVTYSIVYYNLMEQTRSEHGPEDDPLDDITGLCCCPNLKIFASASRDGSVKVWNIENKLLRHLKLNTIPESLAFANPQGDLLVGIERHLYLIHHIKYLPSYYNMTLLCARFLQPIQDTPLPIRKSCFDHLVRGNARRLMQEPPAEEDMSSLPGAHQMTPKETKVIRNVQVEAKGSVMLDARSQDLQQLQRGKVRAVQKVRPTKEMRDEAFEQYLQIFYKKQPHMEIPEEDVFNADEVLEAICRCGSISELYGPNPSNMFLGAFPQLASLKAASELLKDAGSIVDRVSVASSTASVIPPPGAKQASFNQLQVEKEKSVLAEAEGKRPVPAPQDTKTSLVALKIPSLSTTPSAFASAADLAQKPSGALRAPLSAESFIETVFGKVRIHREEGSLFSDHHLERELTVVPEDEPRFSPSPSLPGSLASIGEVARSEKILSSEEPVTAVGSQESSKGGESSLRPRSQTPSEILKGFFAEPAASKEQLRSEMEPESLLLPKVSSGFIPNSVVTKQFHGLEYPSAESLVRAQKEPQTALGAKSVEDVVQDQQPGRDPSEAKLSSISGASIQESSSRVFLTQLDESHYPETEARSEEEIPAPLWQFQDADWFKQLFPQGFPPEMGLDEFLARLLAAFPTVDFSTKTQLLDAVLSLREAWGPGTSGTVHDVLISLLNMKEGAPSMQEETQQRFILAALRALLILNKGSKDLVVELMAYYLQAPPATRLIIEGLIEVMGVQDPHHYFYKEMNSWQVEKDRSKEQLRRVCSLWLEAVMQELQEHRALTPKHQVHPGGKHLRKHYSKAKVAPAQWKDACSEHPVDAINYFAQKQQERQLEEIKRLVAQSEELPRDMVMPLPPLKKSQAILRLGETNAMLRNRIHKHADFYFPFIFSRYLLKGFVPFVKLPVPKINLDPFPSISEKPVPPQTFTAKQQSVQKYFIPKFSYADSYP